MKILEKEKQAIRKLEQRPEVKSLWRRILRHYILFFWDPVFIYMGIIFYLSSMPKPPVPAAVTAVFASYTYDVLHLAVYFVLAFGAGIAMRHSKHLIFSRYHYVLSFLLAGVFGISDEIHQFFVPGRVMSFYDVVIDFAGAFLAVIFRWFLKNEKKLLDKIF